MMYKIKKHHIDIFYMNYKLKKQVEQLLFKIDTSITELYSKCGHEQGTLRSICLHAISKNSNQSKEMPPGLETSIDDLRSFIDTLLLNGYKFITPLDITKCIKKKEKYVIVTFDDGYYSTSYAVDIFKEYGMKLTIFISPYYLDTQIGFWSDIFYREFMKTHSSLTPDFSKKSLELRYSTQEKREKFLIKNFGKKSLKPIGDNDRPLTLNELKDLYANGNVEIGNHSMTHSALDRLSPEQAKKELKDAQEMIHNKLNLWPTCIAYPYGFFNKTTPTICKKLGFQYGLTTENHRHSVKEFQHNKGFQHIGRFGNWGKKISLKQYLLKIRAGFLFSENIKNIRNNFSAIRRKI